MASYVFFITLFGLSSSLKLSDVVPGEDDGTMSTFTSPSAGVYSVAAANPDAYVRFTFPTGCYNLQQFTYLRMTVWASPGTQFTLDLRKGFPDCRIDLHPYFIDTGSALVSYYTAAGTFNGSPGGQLVQIPLAHFNVDLTHLVQVFVSSFYDLPTKGPITSITFGNIEFVNDPAPFTVPQSMPQNPTTYSCMEPYTLAVTFDNQYSGNLNQVLDDLKRLNAKCTVFQIGGELVQNDLAMKRLMQEGHQVAAHTWTHPDLLLLNEDKIRTEMILTDQALQTRLGVKTRWFRPPFGHQDPRVRKILNDMGYVSIIWDIDSTDYFNQNNKDLVWSRIVARLDKMDPKRAGGILLLHNDILTSANLVAKSIEYAMTKGFTKFVTVEECMQGKFNAFLNVTTPPTQAMQQQNQSANPTTPSVDGRSASGAATGSAAKMEGDQNTAGTGTSSAKPVAFVGSLLIAAVTLVLLRDHNSTI